MEFGHEARHWILGRAQLFAVLCQGTGVVRTPWESRPWYEEASSTLGGWGG